MAEESSAAVYVSWPTFKNAIEHLAEGIPNRIDRSTFPGLSGGVQSQLLAGLKFLGLITGDNKPTTELHTLAVQDEGARKERLKALLQERYTELFALDLIKTTPNELSSRMSEAYSVTGDTKEKAIRFFLSAVTYVGMPVSRLFKMPGATTTSNSTRTRRRTTSRQKPPAIPEPNEKKHPQGTSRVVSLASGGTLTLAASLDLFSLSPDDRKFVFELIDKLDGYEKEHAQTEKGTQ
jgi:hypothetical protein